MAPVTDWIEADHSIQPEQIKEKILELSLKHIMMIKVKYNRSASHVAV